MPIYDYDCAACGGRFEVIHGVHAEGPTTCELCGGGPVRKAVTAAAVHYRGSGWAKKERRSAGAGKPAKDASTPDGAGAAAGGSDGAASDRDAGDAPAGGEKPARDGDTPAKRSESASGATESQRTPAADTSATASSKRTD